MHTIIFANGVLSQKPQIHSNDLIIAADGGARHCLDLGLAPNVVIGDMDSLTPHDLRHLEDVGSELVNYPARKDHTDLELALAYAWDHGHQEVIVYAALGDRWDQTLANLLLPASSKFAAMQIRLIDGAQEIQLIRAGQELALSGAPGDIVSLVPLTGAASGITTTGLEYPLIDETLTFASTRGVSNVLIESSAAVSLKSGILLCSIIHNS